jgi:hypothetical protein
MRELRDTVFCGEERSSFCLKVPTLNPLVFLIRVVSILLLLRKQACVILVTSSLEIYCFIFKILLVLLRARGSVVR